MRLCDCWYMSFTPNGGACQNPLEDRLNKDRAFFTRLSVAFLPVLLNTPVTLIANGWISQKHCQRIFPAHQALATALESVHTYRSIKELSQDPSLMGGVRLVQSVAIIALTLFQLPLGLMAMTARDLSVEMGHCLKELREGSLQGVVISVEKIVLYTLYLVCTYSTNTLPLGILYASAQVVSSLYHSTREFWQGDWIALAGHAAVALQQGQRVQNLQIANKIIANMNRFCVKIREVPAFANS